MARINNLTNFLTDVATAIKTKKGSEASIPATNFDTEILALPSQGVYEQRVLNISANGSQMITPSAGFDAIDELTLTVAVPEKQLQSKTYNFTQNTNIELLPDTGYDGFDSVTLNISVPGSTINNQDKTITENGTYQADQGYTGLGTVTVNVTDQEYATNLALSQQILAGTSLYTELEYIESTGTQYIDTGIFPTTINKVDTSAMFTSATDNRIFGARYSLSGDKFVIGVNYSVSSIENKIQYGYGSDSWRTLEYTYIPVNKYFNVIFEFVIDGSSGKITLDGASYNVTSESGVSQLNNTSIYLFAINTPYLESTQQFGIARMYNCKMYGYSGSLVRDLIPVKRTSDNEICMFDKVTNQFFTNQGTGSFIAGPEIS